MSPVPLLWEWTGRYWRPWWALRQSGGITAWATDHWRSGKPHWSLERCWVCICVICVISSVLCRGRWGHICQLPSSAQSGFYYMQMFLFWGPSMPLEYIKSMKLFVTVGSWIINWSWPFNSTQLYLQLLSTQDVHSDWRPEKQNGPCPQGGFSQSSCEMSGSTDDPSPMAQFSLPHHASLSHCPPYPSSWTWGRSIMVPCF